MSSGCSVSHRDMHKIPSLFLSPGFLPQTLINLILEFSNRNPYMLKSKHLVTLLSKYSWCADRVYGYMDRRSWNTDMVTCAGIWLPCGNALSNYLRYSSTIEGSMEIRSPSTSASWSIRCPWRLSPFRLSASSSRSSIVRSLRFRLVGDAGGYLPRSGRAVLRC